MRQIVFRSISFTIILLTVVTRLYGQAGDPDPDFRTTNANGVVYAIALQDDRRILIGGNFTELDGTVRNGVARLLPDGTLDQSFDPGIGGSQVFNIVVQPDGRILVGGTFDTFNGSSAGLTRLNSDGSRDTNFSNGSLAYAYALAYHPSGKIYIAQNNYVRRLNSDGTVDDTFSITIPPDGFNGFHSSVDDFRVLPDGKILLGETFMK